MRMFSDKKVTEKNINVICKNSAWQLPEPVALTTAKTYRDKKIIPLLEKVKEALVAALIQNIQLKETVDKLKHQVERLQKTSIIWTDR